MPVPGQLTRGNLSFSTPSDAPFYPPPPYDYPDATLLVVEFETDPTAAARILPAQAELDDRPVAGLAFADYPQSTLGPYREVILYVHATYQGHPVQYAARFYVTTDAALAAGREQAGIPKKLGAIRFGLEGPAPLAAGQVLAGSLERPAGTPIASASARLVKRLNEPTPGAPAVPIVQTFDYLSLRLVPSPTFGQSPSLCELIETKWTMTAAEVWEAEADTSTTFDTGPPVDSFLAVPLLAVRSLLVIRGLMSVAANTDNLTRPF